jgi:hypothetical protein
MKKKTSSSNHEQLRNVLREKTESLSQEALKNPEQIDAQKIAALKCLARIVAIGDNIKPPPMHKRWPVAAILVVVLLIVSGLLFVPVRSTEIELDSALTKVVFELSKPNILLEGIKVSELRVSELRNFQLPPTGEQGEQTVSLSDGKLRVAVGENPNSPGIITLGGVDLPAGTRVEVSWTEIPDQCRLTLEVPQQSQLNPKVVVRGTIQIICSSVREPMDFNTSSPRPIQMQPVANRVTFNLILPKETKTLFALQLPVENLGFTQTKQFASYPFAVSTILSGKLYLIELNGREYPLRSGEGLRFKQSEGLLRVLTFQKDQLALQFQGSVRGMSTGWEKNRTNLMPTCLEWLKAQQGLVLLWGATFVLFGLLDRVFKWWKG